MTEYYAIYYRSTKRIRFEFVDEEKLMKSLLFNMDIYYLLLVFRTYVLAQVKDFS